MSIALFIVVIVVIGFFVWYYTRDSKLIRVRKGQVFNIKNSIELTGIPVITLYQNDKKYNFMLDTGSNVSYIDKNAGLEVSELLGVDSFLSATSDGNRCTVHSIELYYDNKSFVIPVRVTDFYNQFDTIKKEFGVGLSGILGGDFLSKYSYVLDYAEYVVYRRKL